jgi:Na+/serine symporter
MINIDWSKLVDLEYWLEGIAGSSSLTPVIERGSSFFWAFLYLFSGMLVFGVALRVTQAFLHSQHPLQKQFPTWGNNLIWMGILGLIWFTLRETSVGFLGARIWLLVGLVWLLVLLYFVIRYFIVFYPLEISYYKKNFKLVVTK